MPTKLTETETLVHHAVVDLYEVYNLEAVTAVHVSKLLGMPWGQCRTAMVSLQSQGVLAMDSSDEQVVYYAENAGYYPLAQQATMDIINSREGRK